MTLGNFLAKVSVLNNIPVEISYDFTLIPTPTWSASGVGWSIKIEKASDGATGSDDTRLETTIPLLSQQVGTVDLSAWLAKQPPAGQYACSLVAYPSTTGTQPYEGLVSIFMNPEKLPLAGSRLVAFRAYNNQFMSYRPDPSMPCDVSASGNLIGWNQIFLLTGNKDSSTIKPLVSPSDAFFSVVGNENYFVLGGQPELFPTVSPNYFVKCDTGKPATTFSISDEPVNGKNVNIIVPSILIWDKPTESEKPCRLYASKGFKYGKKYNDDGSPNTNFVQCNDLIISCTDNEPMTGAKSKDLIPDQSDTFEVVEISDILVNAFSQFKSNFGKNNALTLDKYDQELKNFFSNGQAPQAFLKDGPLIPKPDISSTFQTLSDDAYSKLSDCEKSIIHFLISTVIVILSLVTVTSAAIGTSAREAAARALFNEMGVERTNLFQRLIIEITETRTFTDRTSAFIAYFRMISKFYTISALGPIIKELLNEMSYTDWVLSSVMIIAQIYLLFVSAGTSVELELAVLCLNSISLMQDAEKVGTSCFNN